MGSWLEVGQITGWVMGDELPMITLTCSTVEILFPGISRMYGADTIVDIHYDMTSLSNFTSNAPDQDVTVLGTANMQFWPRVNGTSELAVELNL